MNMIKVLVVDDEENIRILMEAKLSKNYEVYTAENGQKAYDLLENLIVDLLLVDVMMPVMDGYTLVEKLRTDRINTPAIMITAKSEVQDKIKGFISGVDDYMTKPINFEELEYRMKAILRRNKINRDKMILINDVIINSENLTIKSKDGIQFFPQKEFQLLFQLLSYPEIIFTKEEILDTIWGFDTESDETTLRTHINRLRDKTKEYQHCFEIITIRGLGYKAVIYDEKK